MNYGTFKTRLLYNAGNLPSDHTLVSGTNGGGDFVNEAIKLTVLRASERYPNFELFPEHKDIEWTDVTIANQNYLALPNDQIAIQRVFSLDSSTAPNLNNSDWQPLSWIHPAGFDQLEKPTTQNAYPRLYTLREGRIYFHPTPRTSWTTYVKIDGIQDEPELSSSSDSPRTHSRWHPAILDYATYLIKSALGHDDADDWLEKCDQKIKTVGGPMVALRKVGIKRTVKVAGGCKGMVW